jgi:hypothetical protein
LIFADNFFGEEAEENMEEFHKIYYSPNVSPPL